MGSKYLILLLFGFNLSAYAQEWRLINAADSLENYYVKTDSWPSDLSITSQYKQGDTLLLHEVSSACYYNAFTQIMFVHGTDSIRAYRTLQHLFTENISVYESYGALPIPLGKLWLSDYECEFGNHCGSSSLAIRMESFSLNGMYSGVLDSSCGYNNLIDNFFPEQKPVTGKRKSRT